MFPGYPTLRTGLKKHRLVIAKICSKLRRRLKFQIGSLSQFHTKNSNRYDWIPKLGKMKWATKRLLNFSFQAWTFFLQSAGSMQKNNTTCKSFSCFFSNWKLVQSKLKTLMLSKLKSSIHTNNGTRLQVIQGTCLKAQAARQLCHLWHSLCWGWVHTAIHIVSYWSKI